MAKISCFSALLAGRRHKRVVADTEKSGRDDRPRVKPLEESISIHATPPDVDKCGDKIEPKIVCSHVAVVVAHKHKGGDSDTDMSPAVKRDTLSHDLDFHPHQRPAVGYHGTVPDALIVSGTEEAAAAAEVEVDPSAGLKRSCSNIETKRPGPTQALQGVPARSRSYGDLKDLPAGGVPRGVTVTEASPASVKTSRTADGVMLERRSSSQVLPSRSRKLWWRLFLWSHRNLHRPWSAHPSEEAATPGRHTCGGYTSDTLQEPERKKAMVVVDEAPPVPNHNQQWVAFCAENSLSDRVSAWVSSIDKECLGVAGDQNTEHAGDCVVAGEPVGKSRQRCAAADEVAQANSIVHSLDAFSSVAHISGMARSPVPHPSPPPTGPRGSRDKEKLPSQSDSATTATATDSPLDPPLHPLSSSQGRRGAAAKRGAAGEMWVFYLISLPLTLGMVIVTLRYFAGPGVPRNVIATVGYAWFCSLSFIILVPADIWTTLIGFDKGGIGFFWSWSYWSTFILTWAVVPTIQGYEDAGDFTVKERLKTSIHMNLLFYSIVGAIGLFGLILLLVMHRAWDGGIVGFAMACSNTFGLVTGAFLLGFGLSEIPRNIWKNADWTHRQKVLSHRVAKIAVKLDNAHQDYSNTIVVAQATSNQMSKRDLLRPYMDIIDQMVAQMLRDDPSFKPSGGRLGENDMDYDTDDKTMATLRRQLRRAHEEYYRCKSEYMTYVMEALNLEDDIKNYECRDATGWKYVSSFRESRPGRLGSLLDTMEFIWRCILRKQLQKALAVMLGCMSAAILLAEATLLPSGVDLSLFSILVKSVGKREVLVQVAAFAPLLYMCICTYYSLFQIGMLMFYSLTPRQTSSVSLLMICSMVARYAPPISYNFLNLIRLGGNVTTTFEKRMGNIDDAVPFFGRGFNRIYPLIMVVYTLLVASNFFGRVIDYFGRWKVFKFQREEEHLDGFDPSGMIILQKERSWIEQGYKVGEQVIPLARFKHTDVESGKVENIVEMNEGTTSRVDGRAGQSKYAQNREIISNKYSSVRDQSRLAAKPVKKETVSASVSLLEEGNSEQRLPAGITQTWASVKNGFQNFKANMGSKKFTPLRQDPGYTPHSNHSSPESLDDIFQRIKRRPADLPVDYLDEDDDDDTGDSDPTFPGSRR